MPFIISPRPFNDSATPLMIRICDCIPLENVGEYLLPGLITARLYNNETHQATLDGRMSAESRHMDSKQTATYTIMTKAKPLKAGRRGGNATVVSVRSELI